MIFNFYRDLEEISFYPGNIRGVAILSMNLNYKNLILNLGKNQIDHIEKTNHSGKRYIYCL